MKEIDYQAFYGALYEPLKKTIGPVDANTIVAIIGFDAGGPLNFCTIGAEAKSGPITYVSCELAVRDEQVPAKDGGYRYELLASCDDEKWVRKVLTNLGRMSLETAFDHGHTIDIGQIVNGSGLKGMLQSKPTIQGVLLCRECTAEFEGTRYGILRCVGLTRREMEHVLEHGAREVVKLLKEAEIWPHTLTRRKSVI